MKKKIREKVSLSEKELEIAEAKKQIVRSGMLSFCALFAIVFVSVAWFANNSRVGANGTEVSVMNNNIELRSKGSNGVHDDILKSIKKSNGFWYSVLDTIRTTSGEENCVNWLLSGSSNLVNYSNEKVEFGENFSQREDYAIEPGTKGNLTFYVVSDFDGDLSLDLTLTMTPYRAEDNGTYTKVSGDSGSTDAYANQFLRGHVLYFLKTANNETTSYEWIKNETFHIDIENAEANKEYEYTIYWVWPQNLSQIILNTGDPYLNNQTAEFDGVDEGIRPSIIEDMSLNPEKYFYNSLTKEPLDTDYVEVKAINTIHSESPDTSKYEVQKFVDLSSFYNQADQIIGGNISFIELNLRLTWNVEVTR